MRFETTRKPARLSVTARFDADGAAIDPAAQGMTIDLAAGGTLLYSRTLAAGAMKANRARTSFTFHDPASTGPGTHPQAVRPTPQAHVELDDAAAGLRRRPGHHAALGDERHGDPHGGHERVRRRSPVHREPQGDRHDVRALSRTPTGSRTRNVAPAPGALSTAIVPPWRSTSRFAIARPTPVPELLVV